MKENSDSFAIKNSPMQEAMIPATDSRSESNIKEDVASFLVYELIKKEEPEDDTIDKLFLNVPEPNHMFDDVDGPEYVDKDYEGLAEVDGVDYFICGGA